MRKLIRYAKRALRWLRRGHWRKWLRPGRKPKALPRVVVPAPTIIAVAALTAGELARVERRFARRRGATFLFTRTPVASHLYAVVAPTTLAPREMIAICQALVNLGAFRAVRLITKISWWQLWFPRRLSASLAAASPEALPAMRSLAETPAAPATASAPRLSLDVVGEAPPSAHEVVFVAPPAAMPGPLVSVVMTTYNEAAYIRQAVASVQAQTHRNLEIIIVDDASTDNTVEVLRGLADADPRLTIIALPRNQGLFFARNTGMQRATGEFLTFHDADDVSRVDRIARCLERLGDADYVYGHYARTTPEGAMAPMTNGSIYREGIITLFLAWARVQAAAGYFDLVKAGADSEYFERLRMLGLRGKSLPDVLYYARLRAGSLTTEGALTLFSLSGERRDNVHLKTYVENYRKFHRSGAPLRLGPEPLERNFVTPRACMTGDQLRWLEARLPWLSDATHPLIAAHAVELLCRSACLPGRASLRQLLAAGDDHGDVVVVAATNRTQHIDQLIENFARQRYARKRLVIVDNCAAPSGELFASRLAAHGVAAEVLRVEPSHNLGYCLNQAIAQAVPAGTAIAKFDDDDIYGELYLNEQMAVLAACGGLVGKLPIFYYASQHGRMYVRPKDKASIAQVTHVSGATLTFERALWERLPFDETVARGSDSNFVQRVLAQPGGSLISTSLFNFCAVRRDPTSHTWNVADDELFKPKMAELVAQEVAEAQVRGLVSLIAREDKS